MRCVVPVMLAVALMSASLQAGYPVSSRLARQADGPYQPRTNRYIVVDPTPPAGALAHDGATPQWTRHNVAAPAYPYGWFGVRAATNRWSHTGYYDDYTDMRITRGR